MDGYDSVDAMVDSADHGASAGTSGPPPPSVYEHEGVAAAGEGGSGKKRKVPGYEGERASEFHERAAMRADGSDADAGDSDDEED